MQEQAWIERAQNGDTEAFEALVRAYEKQVYHLALRFINHPEDAFDISQETFLRAWRGIRGFRAESSFATWLYRLTSNQCVDFARKHKRGRQREVPLESPDDDGSLTPLDIPDTRFSPETAAEKAEFTHALSEALAKLKPELRMIFLLRESGGLSYAEIAAALSLEEGTVKSRLSRARERLRMLLADYLARPRAAQGQAPSPSGRDQRADTPAARSSPKGMAEKRNFSQRSASNPKEKR